MNNGKLHTTNTYLILNAVQDWVAQWDFHLILLLCLSNYQQLINFSF